MTPPSLGGFVERGDRAGAHVVRAVGCQVEPTRPARESDGATAVATGREHPCLGRHRAVPASFSTLQPARGCGPTEGTMVRTGRSNGVRPAPPPAARVGTAVGRPPAGVRRGAALRRPAGVPDPCHRRPARDGADQAGLRRRGGCDTGRAHHRGAHRPRRRRQGDRALAAVERAHRAGLAAHRRAGHHTAPAEPRVAAPRQLDQPRLRLRRPCTATSTRSARVTRPRRSWSSRRSCARSTRTSRDRPTWTWTSWATAGCGSARPETRPRSARASSPSPSSAPSWRASSRSDVPTTRTCPTSTAACCTASRTPQTCPSPTACTPARRPSA